MYSLNVYLNSNNLLWEIKEKSNEQNKSIVDEQKKVIDKQETVYYEEDIDPNKV